jgi:hypothetical protein
VSLLVLLDYEGFDFVVFLWIMAGKHLVRCQRRSGAPLVSSVAVLAGSSKTSM